MSPAKTRNRADAPANEVAILQRQRGFAIDSRRLRTAFLRLLSRCRVRDSHLTVVLVSDRAIRRINRAFRHVDGPTDVLSFPAPSLLPGIPGPRPLGDIVLSLETIARQAGTRWNDGRPQCPTPRHELALMSIHGLLHLLGYDHEGARPGRARAMLRKEIDLFALAAADFPDFRPRQS